ncbi:sugar phosphate nucleotidyltransferase [Cognaticolwellia mytili]|uniref:sugar phosphate nucleotidyltransferase n=1 Tax=Cognaticolwellia mytili TaxID=1888913 RepID=UPI000A16FD1F|nr:sugar phosphate nucleotidyltransferase [Cognaticolwellia mytili]
MTQLNTLVILAAGNGSRFGGAKQFACFGKMQLTLMEYNIHHAMDAGFNHVIFITQNSQKKQLKQEVISRLPRNLSTNIIIQSLDALPENCHISPTRTKPLGTAHALWCAKDVISDNFAVINADDYYGRQAFNILKQQVASSKNDSYTMVAYLVQNTLSDHGGVNRGLCEHNDKMQLKKVTEVENIQRSKKDKNTVISGKTSITQQRVSITNNTLVSMNFWAFNPKIFSAIEQELINQFTLKADDKTECYLPTVIMSQLEQQRANVDVLISEDDWFGVTYSADSVFVDSKINQIFSPPKSF